MTITYTFTLQSGEVHQFDVHLERGMPPAHPNRAYAPWTRLEFQQCTNCPLKSDRFPYCPTAVDLEQIAHRFSSIKSFEKARVEVRTPDRTYTKHCDVQTGLRALLGLIMATSACPISSQLKGLAHYHLPFASIEETLFRVVGAYLIKQYFVQQAGGQPDWTLASLDRYYRDLQELNTCFKGRLDAASDKDANLNAICSLNFLSIAVASGVEDQLDRLQPRFFGGG
ncbi:hypothetical protein NXS98_12255 [Fontisphaera persica]|uniref:DUF6901 family protein n=1 Tax=Fontisphaera persica TaxID=2974023 RepID=UPI0024C0B89E|nr:hypothetical protein [Fontisphaera persica]WCJ58492.1 hypothetical protein NXS98_12255 [Fontisphaera persica]